MHPLLECSKKRNREIMKQKPKEELMTIRIMVNISPNALEKNWGGSKKAARKAASNFVNNMKL